jgi:hypothetical protein
MSRPVVIGALRSARSKYLRARRAHYAVPACRREGEDPRVDALFASTQAAMHAAEARLNGAEGAAEDAGVLLPWCGCRDGTCSACIRQECRRRARGLAPALFPWEVAPTGAAGGRGLFL